jgi:hypothetical protein
MPSSSPKRRLFFGLGVLAAALLALVVLARLILVGLAVGVLLKGVGASEISYHVVQVTPWRVVVEDIGFQLGSQPCEIRRVSLGSVQVERVRVPVSIDAFVRQPLPVARKVPAETPPLASRMPFEDVSVDGELVVSAAGQPAQTLTVKIAARPTAVNVWNGNATVDGPGFGLKAEASYDLAGGALEFKVSEVSLDLKTWQGFLQRVASVPADNWELEGRFTGSAQGRLAGGKLTAAGTLHVLDGRAIQTKPAVSAEGIEVDVEFTDLEKFTTRPGTLRIRELRTGQLALRNLDYEFAFEGFDRIAVSRASLLALGGSVSAERFILVPSQSRLEAVLLVDGINVEEVLALTKDLPARATGRVSGRFPMRIDQSGLQFGTGWLGLKPGVYAEIQFNAKGLLTGGMSPNSPGYAVLEKVESGLLKLKVSELRLDIRPPNSPPGRSAQLHLAGEPVDPTVKAPVTLDLNVNGPIEKLLNMGMDSRLSFGAKP